MSSVKSKVIMVIDDDPGLRDAIPLVFHKNGFAISVHSGPEHLLQEQTERPDLIILDRLLSGVDGLDVCRKLKADDHMRDIPIIMLSATPDIATAAKQAGANVSLQKPFRIAELRLVAVGLMS